MDNKTLEKIRSILARADANRNDNENEREIAMRQANALLAKHGLSMADVEESEQSEELGAVGRSAVPVGRNVWQAGVFDRIAELNHCKVIRSTAEKKVWIIGRRLHVQITQSMGQFVVDSILREARSKRHNITQFGNGAWTAIGSRVRKILAEQADGFVDGVQTGKGLILVDQHKKHLEAANSAVSEFFGRVKSGGYSHRGGSGYEAGKAYGSKVNFGSGSIGGGRQRRIGQ